MLEELVQKSRSYRRYDASHILSEETLRNLIDLTRFTPSAANRQPLKYYLSCSAVTNALIFPCLGWAGYLKNWDGPSEGERPTGYIIILGDDRISSNVQYDHGIAAQTIMLGAAERGLGGCMIASINRGRLKQELELPDYFSILLVLALGKPAEKVIVEPIAEHGSIQYWRDESGIHHVPKRSLDEIIVAHPSAQHMGTGRRHE